MTLRKTISLVVATTLACSVLFTSVVSAESISEQKIKLMIAAGELPANSGEAKNTPEPKIGKDAAISIAKKMLEDPSLFEVGYVSLNPNWGGTNNRTWSIEFMRPKAPGGNASVVVDSETGDVINFNCWEGYDGQTNFVAKMTKAEARIKAEEYIKSQLKEDVSNYELQKEDPYSYGYKMGGVKEPVNYNFYYIRKVNGVPFSNHTISIGIDGINGKLRSFSLNRMKVSEDKFPSTKDIISPEKAMENYKSSTSVKLQYVTTYSNMPYGMSKQKVMLAYVPATYVGMLDAKTGKAINQDGTALEVTSDEIKKLLNNPVPMNPDAKLTDKAMTEKDAKAKAEAYKKIVEEALGISFDGTNENEYRPYYYDNNVEGEVWNFNWNKNSEKGHVYFNISISAKTGHIINASVNNFDNAYEMRMKEGKKQEAVVEKVDWNQGKQKALEMLKKLAPEQYGFYVDENIKEPQLNDETKKYAKDHGYHFTRIVNGLRFRDNTINFGIDRQTGALRSFHFSWSDTDFPEKTSVITEEEAAKKYFDGTEAKLSYFLEFTFGGESRTKYAEVPRLGYNFTTKNQGSMYGNLIIDAKTGKQVDMYGNGINFEPSTDEPNLAEHWAKRSAELLIAQGILKNPNVDLDTKVTKAEAVKMMTLSRGMNYYYDGMNVSEATFTDVPKDNEYFLYVESAIKQKIIAKESNEFKGDVKLTKSEFVKLLINLVGYADIAKHSDIFKVSNSVNVSSEMTGYVAIASVLDILPIKSGESFNGNAEITYGEAAVSLYKALGLIK